MSNLVMVAGTDIAAGLDRAQPLEDRARAAMKAAASHWLGGDEDRKFRSAVAGLLLAEPSEEDRARIEAEMAAIVAVASGNVDAIAEAVDRAAEVRPVGLLRLWREEYGGR